MSQEQLEQYIENYCEYLVEEGVAVRMENGRYRMKTEEEIEKEIQDIVNSDE